MQQPVSKKSSKGGGANARRRKSKPKIDKDKGGGDGAGGGNASAASATSTPSRASRPPQNLPPEVVERLEAVFASHRKPTDADIIAIAADLSLSKTAVTRWFKTKRRLNPLKKKASASAGTKRSLAAADADALDGVSFVKRKRVRKKKAPETNATSKQGATGGEGGEGDGDAVMSLANNTTGPHSGTDASSHNSTQFQLPFDPSQPLSALPSANLLSFPPSSDLTNGTSSPSTKLVDPLLFSSSSSGSLAQDSLGGGSNAAATLGAPPPLLNHFLPTSSSGALDPSATISPLDVGSSSSASGSTNALPNYLTALPSAELFMPNSAASSSPAPGASTMPNGINGNAPPNSLATTLSLPASTDMWGNGTDSSSATLNGSISPAVPPLAMNLLADPNASAGGVVGAAGAMTVPPLNFDPSASLLPPPGLALPHMGAGGGGNADSHSQTSLGDVPLSHITPHAHTHAHGASPMASFSSNNSLSTATTGGGSGVGVDNMMMRKRKASASFGIDDDGGGGTPESHKKKKKKRRKLSVMLEGALVYEGIVKLTSAYRKMKKRQAKERARAAAAAAGGGITPLTPGGSASSVTLTLPADFDASMASVSTGSASGLPPPLALTTGEPPSDGIAFEDQDYNPPGYDPSQVNMTDTGAYEPPTGGKSTRSRRSARSAVRRRVFQEFDSDDDLVAHIEDPSLMPPPVTSAAFGRPGRRAGMTTRQQAYDDAGFAAGGTQFTDEQILAREERKIKMQLSRKRKLQQLKAETIARLLENTALQDRRKERERKAEEKQQEAARKSRLESASNAITRTRRKVIGEDGKPYVEETLSYPPQLLKTIDLTPQIARGYPPPRPRCAVVGCNNPKTGTDPKSNLPFCSLKCSRTLRALTPSSTTSASASSSAAISSSSSSSRPKAKAPHDDRRHAPRDPRPPPSWVLTCTGAVFKRPVPPASTNSASGLSPSSSIRSVALLHSHSGGGSNSSSIGSSSASSAGMSIHDGSSIQAAHMHAGAGAGAAAGVHTQQQYAPLDNAYGGYSTAPAVATDSSFGHYSGMNVY